MGEGEREVRLKRERGVGVGGLPGGGNPHMRFVTDLARCRGQMRGFWSVVGWGNGTYLAWRAGKGMWEKGCGGRKGVVGERMWEEGCGMWDVYGVWVRLSPTYDVVGRRRTELHRGGSRLAS